jgi:hypothetical protein
MCAGRSGIEVQLSVMARYFSLLYSIETSSESHPAPYRMSAIGYYFLGGKATDVATYSYYRGRECMDLCLHSPTCLNDLVIN